MQQQHKYQKIAKICQCKIQEKNNYNGCTITTNTLEKTVKKQFFDVKKCNISGITKNSITITTTTNTIKHKFTQNQQPIAYNMD